MGLNIPKQLSVPLMPNMDDTLLLTFDKHFGDQTLLLVWRIINGEKVVINCMKDEQAEKIYKELVAWGQQ